MVETKVEIVHGGTVPGTVRIVAEKALDVPMIGEVVHQQGERMVAGIVGADKRCEDKVGRGHARPRDNDPRSGAGTRRAFF